MRLVFTDLDGTLLDHETYSFEEAKKALTELKRKKIPLVICTSKTRSEIEKARKRLVNRHPFISENGGAIFIPKKYFSFKVTGAKRKGKYDVIEFSPGIAKVKEAMRKLRSEGFQVKGFSEMNIDEVVDLTGLRKQDAELARKREYDEPFILEGGNSRKLGRRIREMGFRHMKGGRFHHIFKGHDKGLAVEKLTDLYIKEFGDVDSLGLGDSENDFAMLRKVDLAYLVKKPDGRYASSMFFKAAGIGPAGWNKTVLKFAKH